MKQSSMPKIKVCGLTRPEEAGMLARNRIEYAGMVLFYPKSKRNITAKRAAEILMVLPEEIHPVAVTVSPTPEQAEILQELGFHYLQVHGELRKDTIDVCRIPILRAYNITKAPVSAEEHKAIAGYVLDGAIPGSGKPFDWKLNQKLPFDRTERLFLLAGGLNEDNVAEGIHCFHPDIVDISSGVEGDSGKDEEKIRRFAEAVRQTATNRNTNNENIEK